MYFHCPCIQGDTPNSLFLKDVIEVFVIKQDVGQFLKICTIPTAGVNICEHVNIPNSILFCVHTPHIRAK